MEHVRWATMLRMSDMFEHPTNACPLTSSFQWTRQNSLVVFASRRARRDLTCRSSQRGSQGQVSGPVVNRLVEPKFDAKALFSRVIKLVGEIIGGAAVTTTRSGLSTHRHTMVHETSRHTSGASPRLAVRCSRPWITREPTACSLPVRNPNECSTLLHGDPAQAVWRHTVFPYGATGSVWVCLRVADVICFLTA